MGPQRFSEPDDTGASARARPRNVIAWRLAVGFGLVSFVAIAMCGTLLRLIGEVSGLVTEMRADELAIKESLALATTIREQYIHQAHWIITREPAHLHHYETWRERVERGVHALRPIVPADLRWRIDQVAADSQALDALFRDAILPATERDDRAAIARQHGEAEVLSQRATRHADVIAEAVEQKMARAHISATRATRLALAGGGLGVILVLSLSIAYTVRLRRAVLRPLDVLAHAARRFGAGDFQSRVGPVGEGELRAVAEAFDRMVEELEERHARLLESERMAAIGQLAAGIAHEINNPIQVIRGYLRTMSPEAPPELLREELQILDEEAAACQRIAADLVDYARTPELRCSAVPMGELLVESVRRFRETREGADARIDVEVRPGEIVADGGRVRQVMLNLLLNAAQVSDIGEPIEVRGGPAPGGGYDIEVSDRGPGVRPDERDRVFEPFFSQRSDGAGLGLAICRGIVSAHGGSIDVAPRAGGGSTFRVALPSAPPRRSLQA